jgi:hypothetical protein
MSTPQQDPITMTLLPHDIELARQLAEAMNADPEASRDGHPWTVQDVLGVALGRGLERLVQSYLTAR